MKFSGFIYAALWVIPFLGGVGCKQAIVPNVEKPSAESYTDLSAIERNVNDQLFSEQRMLVQWAQELKNTPVTSEEDALMRVIVFLQAGMNQAAVDTLRDLKQIQPEFYEGRVFAIYRYAGRYDAWEVSKAVVELFPEKLWDSRGGNELRLDDLWGVGGTPEELDLWFAEKPDGIRNYWMKERLRHAENFGFEQELLNALSAEAKNHPQDVEGVLRYLDIIQYQGNDFAAKQDTKWIEDEVKPEDAMQAYVIGKHMQAVEKWDAASSFYQRALEISFTDAEIMEFTRYWQVGMNDKTSRILIRASTLENLTECLIEGGHKKAAEKSMMEAVELRKKSGLGLRSYQAGAVQSSTGGEEIEKSLFENADAEDPQVWMDCASYYQGSEDFAQQEACLLKVLTMLKPEAIEQRRGKTATPLRRATALDAYARLLMETNREQEAFGFLRSELQKAPANTYAAERSAYLLAWEFKALLRPDDAVYWDWLAAREIWESTEERLLRVLLANASGESREDRLLSGLLANGPRELQVDYMDKAQTLALNGHPSRSLVLGKLTYKNKDKTRAVKLFQDVIARSEDEHQRAKAEGYLFRILMDVGDWAAAEKIYRQEDGPYSAHETIADLALLAAKAGAKEDAMRLWKWAANVDATNLSDLEEMQDAGLEQELRDFYRNFQQQLPESNVPERALKLLEGEKDEADNPDQRPHPVSDPFGFGA